ncbi:hypothetical protein LPU83_pLPU83d_1920 (plasmid) [Rhizobium favelukesii]|uniref:Uncharacterized protein n=1 Tax=Rhizobium favelukesii TaxID=348824 RepID=W6RSZ1_9HYPH|nr:hypothetical protein LPU83_pLPU83d_1920 [Rhizobium favelukesii]
MFRMSLCVSPCRGWGAVDRLLGSRPHTQRGLVRRRALLGGRENVVVGDIRDRNCDFGRREADQFFALNDLVYGFLYLLTAGRKPVGVVDDYRT